MCLNETCSEVCIGKHLSDEVVALSDYKQEETYRHVFSLAFGS
jgi:hypothetical protein